MTAFVVAPLVLVVVLVVSALAKLRDTGWTSETVTRMGVPEAFAKPWMVRALPWAELVMAVLVLLPHRWSLLGLVPATGLMAVYVVVVVHALRTIANPTCHCFGRLTEGEVTATTVARNVVLTLLGVVAVVDAWRGGGLLSRLARADAADWMWLLALVVVAAVLVLVLREKVVTGDEGGAFETADDDLLDYQRLPIPFAGLTRPDEVTVYLRELVHRQAALLVFMSKWCASCVEVAAEVPDYQRRLEGLSVHPVLVHEGPGGDSDLRFDQVLFDPSGETLRMFGHSYPMAVLLGADGLLAGGPVAGHRAIAEFVSEIEAQMTESAEVGPAEVEVRPLEAHGLVVETIPD